MKTLCFALVFGAACLSAEPRLKTYKVTYFDGHNATRYCYVQAGDYGEARQFFSAQYPGMRWESADELH